MAQSEELFGEGPQACPFIALELDRDRRSDKPDHRHRCFAEPTPQPRQIAHQEQFCLSPDFPTCPIFQGWAMRAAARPVPMTQDYEGRARSAEPGPSAASVGPPPAASGARGSVAQPVLPFDMPPVVPPPGETWPVDAFAPTQEPGAPDQIAAFEVPSATVPGGPSQLVPAAPPVAGMNPPLETGTPPDWSSSSATPNSAIDEDPPVPGFLAGRSERPAPLVPRASQPEVPFRDTVSREDLIPSWDLTDRYGAEVKSSRARGAGGGDSDGGGERFGGLVTTVAVIAILALGVLGVIFLPGMLAGHGSTATATPPHSALPTGLVTPSFPFASETPLVTPGQTAAITPEPTPQATPHLYRVKSTDNSLTQIAHRFGLTLQQLLDANPQITNPDQIRVGQEITIPNPPPAPTPSA
jgi:LysM repeat protein